VADPVNPKRFSSSGRRIPGIDKGKLRIADDFDSTSQQELDEWYGRELPYPQFAFQPRDESDFSAR